MVQTVAAVAGLCVLLFAVLNPSQWCYSSMCDSEWAKVVKKFVIVSEG